MPAKKSDETKKKTTAAKKTTTKKTPAKKPVAAAKKTTTAKRTTTKKPVKKTAASTAKKKTTTTARKRTTTARKKATKVMTAVENQFDEGMADTQAYLKKKVSKKTKKTVANLTKRAEGVASSVEHLGEEVEHFADSIFPTSGWSQGLYNAQFHKKVSRLFVFRFLRWIIQWPVTVVWAIWYMIITIIHYIQMFIMGKRSKYLWNKQVRFWKHVVAWKSYLNGMTDARPEVIHPPVK